SPSHLPSFPTRRSSDLASVRISERRQVSDRTAARLVLVDVGVTERDVARRLVDVRDRDRELLVEVQRAAVGRAYADGVRALRLRSEEHTSELQSPCNLV